MSVQVQSFPDTPIFPELKADAQLLRTIPGLGDTTIAKVLAYAGDVRRNLTSKTYLTLKMQS